MSKLELAVIKAIKEVLGLVKAVYDVSKIINEFFENPTDENRLRYENMMAEIIRSRNQLLNASASILNAIVQLDQTIFRERIADKLGDVDQAEIALDNFRRTGDVGQRVASLNSSAGALADLLQYDSNKVYPIEAMVLHLSQIVLRRIVILREADPGFCTSSITSAPLYQSINIIRAATNQIEAEINLANRINERNRVKRRVIIIPSEEGGGRDVIVTWTFHVDYRNVSGTVAFSGSASTEEGPEDYDYLQQIQSLQNQAKAAQQRGLADDIASAALVEMRNIANQIESTLHNCESDDVGQLIFGRKMNFIERARYDDFRKDSNLKLSLLRLVESGLVQSERSTNKRFTSEADSINKLANRLMNRPFSKEEEKALVAFERAFGSNQVAIAILNHPECKI